MAKNFIYSTLSTGMSYAVWAKSDNNEQEHTIEKKINIAGGANVANPRSLITPRGVVTEVSDQDLALLLENELFQRHVDNKFISIETVKVDPEVVAADMEQVDQSAPYTPNDYVEQKAGAKPVGTKGTSRVAKAVQGLTKSA